MVNFLTRFAIVKKKRCFENSVCNMCGCRIEDRWDIEQDFKIIHKFIAYTPHGRYDGQEIEAYFCNKCANKMVDILTTNCKVDPLKDSGKF